MGKLEIVHMNIFRKFEPVYLSLDDATATFRTLSSIDLMRSPCIATTLIPIYLATSVLAGVKEIWWNITYVEAANPDGLFERRVVGVDNTWPYVFLSCLLPKR